MRFIASTIAFAPPRNFAVMPELIVGTVCTKSRCVNVALG